ncbi:hypothetical protein BASA62_009498 [Batrachochytrium salamandrivorans]|nr:hypothetical protein BASA62_009498 [Batrachochytrium salamandrivorans]
MQSDTALEGFDRLRVREVRPMYGQTASAFLAEFQSIAASLEPDERIELLVYAYESSMDLLKAVLSDPQANKICPLRWQHYEEKDVNSVIPMLTNSCPELALLEVDFEHHSAFDFVSSLLEHPSNKIKVLEMPGYAEGDFARFFAALEQSQVSALALSVGDSSEFDQGLYEYLANDLLVRLKVWMNFEPVPLELMVSLADCTRLTKLEMLQCEFSQPTAFTHLPKSITTLTLDSCRFVGGLDWSFLADSNVRELGLDYVNGVDGNQFGGALAAHLRAKGLDKLRFYDCGFVDETLAVVGVEVGRIKGLDLEESDLNDASLEQIATTLKSPNNEMKELVLEYVTSSIETHLVPALEHPNCNLVKLSLPAYPGHKEAAKTVEDVFYKRCTLFVLLQGRQRRADQQQDMLSCCRGAARRDDRPSFGGQIMPRDEALERFDQLRVREVIAEDYQTAAFLAQFQSIAASLEPDERIKLELLRAREDIKSLKAVLADPQANKICSLRWEYNGKEDVNSIIPLLIHNCPELASLQVESGNHFEFDLVSSMLEHPSNRIKVLVLPRYTTGNIPRLFAALAQSQVSALTLFSDGSPEFAQDLYEYLAKDLLVRLKVTIHYKQVPPEMLMPLAKCTRLAKLEMSHCAFSQSTVFVHFPKCISKLTLNECTFVGRFDWSFLADSNVRELDFLYVRGINGNWLGDALAVHLRAKGLDRLRLSTVSFTNSILAAVGVELGRTKRLDLGYSNLNDASLEQIATALESPNNEMKELKVECAGSTMSGIKDHLVPALKHPNCNLAKLSLWTSQAEHREAALRVEDMFHNRLALFALLQGQQVKRRYCPLKRLPVEMFRLVGKVLI